jgi:hypothetical protein
MLVGFPSKLVHNIVYDNLYNTIVYVFCDTNLLILNPPFLYGSVILVF